MSATSSVGSTREVELSRRCSLGGVIVRGGGGDWFEMMFLRFDQTKAGVVECVAEGRRGRGRVGEIAGPGSGAVDDAG